MGSPALLFLGMERDPVLKGTSQVALGRPGEMHQ